MKMNRRAGIVSATAVLALLATTMGAQSALAAVPAAVPAGVVSAASATEPAFTTVTGGSIMGAKADGVYEYKGVPYATADRYEKPEPASWSDTRKALVYGEVCPNGATTVNVHEFVTPSGQDLVENEDCLNLNVWSTTQDTAAKKPVLVFLHGGGLSNGSSAELSYYDGHNFAKNNDAVVVSVNHRLNVLGYLELSAYGDEYAGTGNLGQLDLIEALKWVQDNAATFGGDINNVTIMGQSGGAQKVGALMAMPAAQGLFQKAIMMSSGPVSIPLDQAQAQTAKVMDKLGVSTVEQLKAVPYADLKAAADATGFVATNVVDGTTLPEATVVDGVFSPLSKDIPVLTTNTFGEVIGNSVALTSWTTSADPLKDAYKPNNDEARVRERLQAQYGDWTDTIIAEFEKQFPDHDLFDLLYFSTIPSLSRLTTADVKSATPDAAPVYTALFAWDLPFLGGVVSVHTGGDIPFVFDNEQTVPELIAGDEEGASAFSDVTSGAFGQFIRTGNPGGTGEGAWPAYSTQNQWTMVFDKDSRLVNTPDRKLYTLIASATAGEPFPGDEEPGTGEPGPGEQPAPAAEDDLTDAVKGAVVVPETAVPGQKIDVSVGASLAGETVWTTVYSTPVSLGSAAVSAEGGYQVTLPDDIALGAHKIAVQAADGTLIGWAPITIVAAAAAPGSLALTGGDIAGLLTISMLLVAGGAIAIHASRRRRGLVGR